MQGLRAVGGRRGGGEEGSGRGKDERERCVGRMKSHF